ncbi:MAG: hypothetical protein IKO49_05910 [Bacilli bacterium]|nr:hypothetical protein [Bacilli bacterium]
MLYTNVRNGILFISIEDEITENTISNLTKEIDFLLYNQGISLYAFNFNYLKNFSTQFLNNFQNKLTEIFLKCGSVVIYGIDKVYEGIFGKRKDNLFYAEKVEDVYNLLSL